MKDCCDDKKLFFYRKMLVCKGCGIVFGPLLNNNHLNSNNKKPSIIASIKQKIQVLNSRTYIEG